MKFSAHTDDDFVLTSILQLTNQNLETLLIWVWDECWKRDHTFIIFSQRNFALSN